MRFVRHILICGIIVAVGVSGYWYRSTKLKCDDSSKYLCSDPLFSGPPEFITLAIIVAFAAYLRQVSLNATELRDKIFHDDVWNYPRETKYAQRKMLEADNTSQTIRMVTPFMILMIVAVGVRIVVDSVVRMQYARGTSPVFLYAVDLFLASCLFLGFIGLAIAHFVARWRDDPLRKSARVEEKTNFERDRGKKAAALEELKKLIREAAQPAKLERDRPLTRVATLLGLFGLLGLIGRR